MVDIQTLNWLRFASPITCLGRGFHSFTYSFVQSSIPSLSGFHCTFENGTCGFNQRTDDILDWTRRSNATLSVDTGPSADHTTGNGKSFGYIFKTIPFVSIFYVHNFLIKVTAYFWTFDMSPRWASAQKPLNITRNFVKKPYAFSISTRHSKPLNFVLDHILF